MTDKSKAENLWPTEIEKIPDLRTPLTLLKEQASVLGDMTGRTVLGEVETHVMAIDINPFHHTFYLRVPSLDNYRYELLEVSHDVRLYPAQVRAAGVSRQVSSEDELKETLKGIFSSGETRNVLTGLVNQAIPSRLLY
jgi:hypothetical protein